MTVWISKALIEGDMESTLTTSYLIVALETVTFDIMREVNASAEMAPSYEVTSCIELSLKSTDFKPMSDVKLIAVLSEVKYEVKAEVHSVALKCI